MRDRATGKVMRASTAARQAAAVAAPAIAPGRPLPTAMARGQLAAVPGRDPRSVPIPGSIPVPTMNKCSSSDADWLWERWKVAHTAVLYAYTMIDFVYQASLKSKSWAKCLWYEDSFGDYALFDVGAGFIFDPYMVGAPYPYHWFGDYDTNRMATIRKYLADILGQFEAPPKLYCEKGDLTWQCSGDANACSWYTSPGRIYFKVEKWKYDFSVSTTIIHELSHMTPPGTRHKGKCGSKKAPFYGNDDATYLAKNCPVLAMTNADNLAMFAMNLYAAVTWGRWWDAEQNKAWYEDFRWGQTCPSPKTGGGGGIPEPCVWSWSSLNQENECITQPMPPDFDEPMPPGLASPQRRSRRRMERSARRRSKRS